MRGQRVFPELIKGLPSQVRWELGSMKIIQVIPLPQGSHVSVAGALGGSRWVDVKYRLQRASPLWYLKQLLMHKEPLINHQGHDDGCPRKHPVWASGEFIFSFSRKHILFFP